MKKLFSLLIVFISIKCFGQVYQVLPQYGYEMKRVNATLVLLLPSDTTNNKTGVARIGTVLYIGNGTKWTASTVTDATKLNISDTASMLSSYAKTSVVNSGLALKVNIADTAAMLTNYAKTSAVNLKVNISDTASMLTNYAKTSAVNSGLALKVNISDTASMLTNYAKTSVVNSGLALKVNISDTATMLSPYAKTSAVNSGLALKVNIADTAAMLTNYAKTSAVNSAVALKVNISDTATMLTSYLRKIDTASLSNRINLKADINSPTFTGTVSGITQSMVGLGNVTNESKATMFTNATFTGTFATAAGAIGNASLANGAVANLSGTNTGDQTTITGNAGTATALQTARTIGTTTGDATSAGSSFDGTANNTNALTLATVNSNVGTFTNSTITVNGKGLITAASSGASGGTVTSVAALTLGTTGTDLSSTVANGTTTPVITLQVPTASATNRGALSSTDWTAFNNKGSVSSIATENTTGITGGTITTTGTLAIDTIVISTRKWRQKGIDSVQANLTTGLALKVNISDTSSMLNSYFRKVDTASLSNRINLKLNISDTSSMLSPYARTNSVNAGLALKVNISDTATMLTSYLRKVDTTAMLSPYKTFYPRTAISLTTTGSSGAATYNNSTGILNVPVYTDAFTGTVTSVATNNGSGITGGTITTSGTLAIDTLLISTRAWRQKGIDSVVALIPSLTGYVPYTGATQDVDLGAFKLNAQSLHVKGTAGNGHLGLKHQSASATASANEVSLFADSLGNLSWQNGNLYLSKFITSGNTAARSYTFPNATGTIALTSDLTGYLTSVTATSPLSSSGGTTPNITIAQATTSVNGYLSSTDWTTFNGKESVLTFSSPLVRTTNTISIPVATTSVNGYLSSTDWTTFNNKQGTITLTTTGTSGAATLVGATLNVPQYADQFVGTVTSVAALTIGTTGTDLSSTVANSTTTPVITLNVPTASATNRGALSSADWTTFNNKAPALSGTTNYVPKFTGASTIGNSAFYDEGGFGGFNSTGLGSRTFVIQAATSRPLAIELVENANVHAVYVRPNNSGYNLISSNYISGGVYIPLALSGRESSSDLVLWTDGNTSIGQSSNAGYKLDVNGTGRFTSNLLAQKVQVGTAATINDATGVGNTLQFANYSAGVFVTASADSYIYKTSSVFGGLSAQTLIFQTRSDVAGGGFAFVAGTTPSAIATISNTGAATYNSSVTATAFIPSGATVPTNGMYLSAANTLNFATNTTNRLTIDASGNLGLGVTPSAWGSAYRVAMQVGGGGSIAGAAGVGGNAPTYVAIGGNYYLNSSAQSIYIASVAASKYEQNAGEHTWYNAPSGTAGNAITFTQAMTLFSTGNLAVGLLTDSGYRLDVDGTARVSGASFILGTNTLANNNQLSINSASGYAQRIAFKVAGTDQWLIGNGAASQNTNFEIYNTLGTVVYSVNRTTNAATFTGAATFSSSVTATQGNFNQTATSGFAINMTNRNNNQTWSLIVDTDAVDDKILGFQSSYGFTPFYALKLDAASGAATFSSSIKTAAPSGGTAKPFKIGAAATVTPTSQNRTIEIEIDGVTYYLTAKTTND